MSREPGCLDVVYNGNNACVNLMYVVRHVGRPYDFGETITHFTADSHAMPWNVMFV